MHSLLLKQMNRKQFVVTCGAIILGVLGITALLKNMTSLLDTHAQSPSVTKGFGSSAYGA